MLLALAGCFTMIALTNVFDGFRELGVLSDGWALASGNFAFMQDITAASSQPDWLTAISFGIIVTWEVAAAGLFWVALALFIRAHGRPPASRTSRFSRARPSGRLFIVMEEVCLAYDVEATHWRLLIASLASILVVNLPSRRSGELRSGELPRIGEASAPEREREPAGLR